MKFFMTSTIPILVFLLNRLDMVLFWNFAFLFCLERGLFFSSRMKSPYLRRFSTDWESNLKKTQPQNGDFIVRMIVFFWVFWVHHKNVQEGLLCMQTPTLRTLKNGDSMVGLGFWGCPLPPQITESTTI